MTPEDGDDDAGEDGAEVVELPLEDVLDLHGFLPQDVAAIVRDYLNDADAAGFAEVRIIHGRGIGTWREMVRHLLSEDSRVARFEDAPFDRGGKGATLVRFRR